MDQAEFTVQIENLRGRMYRITCGLLHNESDREDAAQNAIVKAWQQRDTLRDRDAFSAWFTRILINECYDIMRQQKRMLPFAEMPEEAVINYDIDVDVHDALNRLSDKYRLPVILVYMEGYTVAEVSKILHLPQGTIKTRLRKARQILQSELEGDEPHGV